MEALLGGLLVIYFERLAYSMLQSAVIGIPITVIGIPVGKVIWGYIRPQL